VNLRDGIPVQCESTPHPFCASARRRPGRSGERVFAAVSFQVAGTAFTFHPGDAAGAIEAPGKTKQVLLRSDGGGVDSGQSISTCRRRR
jgi:hypothetical protein